MTSSESPIEVVQHPFAFRLLEVRRVTRLTPRIARVTLAGEQLAGFRSDGPDDDVKLFFPPERDDLGWLPRVEDGRLVFPEGLRPPAREFTPRHYDAAAGELAIDVVLHAEGPAAGWARAARPGDRVGISGPRRSRLVTGRVDWYLLAGDETALPAIARRLESLPAGTWVTALVEVDDAAHELPLASAADLRLRWLHRAGVANPTRLLADALREVVLPEGDGFAWAAGEASAIREVRRYLRDARGIPDGRMRMTGYWKRSVADWDHHQPLE